MICIGSNFVAWFFVLFTIIYHFNASNNSTLYNLNEIILVLLDLVTSGGIFYIGLRNYIRIKDELSPVYVTTARVSDSSDSKANVISSIKSFILGHLDLSGKHTLKAQTQILRTILKVSLIVSVFYLIRAFVFLWKVFYAHSNESPETWPLLSYPLLFYQLPELFPTIGKYSLCLVYCIVY